MQNSNGRFAIKVISKKHLPPNCKSPQREIASLTKLNHPHIMRLVESFESRTKHYIVCEIANGGELFDRIIENGRFLEADASSIISKIVSAIDEAHKNGVVHRDLKPENLLFRSPENMEDIVIADFGISRTVTEDEALFTVCGSPGYCAPEIMMSSAYGKACDMWSIGVIAYTILSGYSPFGPVDRPDVMIKRIFSGPVEFHEKYWNSISNSAKDFVAKLLQVDPKQRMSAKQALDHPWISRYEALALTPKERVHLLTESVREQLQMFKFND